jgi:hypothetical protein
MSSIPASTGQEEEMVLISKARLDGLLKLEAELPTMIEGGIKSRDKERLHALHEKLKADPELKKKKNEEWYAKHKEDYNARRREAYKKRKEPQGAAEPECVSDRS